MDSLFGVEILRRTPNRPRPRYRMLALRLPFDPALPDGVPDSASAVLERARSFSTSLVTNPARFDALREEFCCQSTGDIIDGRNVPALVELLASLQPGELAREPLRLGTAYLIPKLIGRDLHEPSAIAKIDLRPPDERLY